MLVLIFWLAWLGIAYTYVGYPLIIALLARWRARPVRAADITPSVTMLVAAYNEEACIEAKIGNTLALDYPADYLDLLVVSDGSTDRTNEIVSAHAGQGVRLLHEPQRAGKVGALLRAFPHVRGEIVVFSDANALFQPDALRKLVRHFADPEVGGVSGAKRIVAQGGGAVAQGEGLYWRYESFIKSCDSAVSSVMGVPGEIWAVRREAYIPPEPNTILDDFVASLRLVQAGWRVVYDPEAISTEEASPSLGAEWARRARNAAGGWQAFVQLPGMLRHPSRLITFQYLSHRMLRWMITPVLFALLLLANVGLLVAPFYRLTLFLQLVFYLAAGLGWVLAARGVRVRGLLIPLYVCLLNAAALAGGWRYLRGKQSAVWSKVRGGKG